MNFHFEYPVFEHKNLLKKSMLDELRDYPVEISRMCLADWGDGILSGVRIGWEKEQIFVTPGLVLYDGNIYRMENNYILPRPDVDRVMHILLKFRGMENSRDGVESAGEIILEERKAETGEMELGRFRLQAGARLRTSYENFEDYSTQFDTVNRINVPYACQGGTGLWPQLLVDYAKELLETGTRDNIDISFAMQLMAAEGAVAAGFVRWFVEKSKVYSSGDNQMLYTGLLYILKERRTGRNHLESKNGRRQMVLL